ncbi:hypothetical protein FQZ97_1181310 [compost metagenome]
MHAVEQDVGDHHPGAGAGRRFGEGQAEAAGAAGDQHTATVEKGVQAHGIHTVLRLALGR